LDPLDDLIINEDAGPKTVALIGISAGGGESQSLTVTATSSNPALIPNPTVTYTSPNTNGSLSFAPIASESGAAMITVTLQDNGGLANGGVDTTTNTFLVMVNSVNDAPTLEALNDLIIPEDAGPQIVELTGITAGAGELQALSVTAISSNPALIPNPAVTYTNPTATGSLSFAPVANASGTATITVRVQDNGGTANGGVDTTAKTFSVTVNAVNDAPTLDPLDDLTINEDAGPQTVNLTGISAGGGESQSLSLTAVSSNPALIPDPTVTYTAVSGLKLPPLANANGDHHRHSPRQWRYCQWRYRYCHH
jgi:hypothetical protein